MKVNRMISCSICFREESENPKVWARICINKLAELAKESTTMRRLLDPMLVYFDIGKHWPPLNGLALIVLSDMAYFVKGSGKPLYCVISIYEANKFFVSYAIQLSALDENLVLLISSSLSIYIQEMSK